MPWPDDVPLLQRDPYLARLTSNDESTISRLCLEEGLEDGKRVKELFNIAQAGVIAVQEQVALLTDDRPLIASARLFSLKAHDICETFHRKPQGVQDIGMTVLERFYIQEADECLQLHSEVEASKQWSKRRAAAYHKLRMLRIIRRRDTSLQA